jgi:hypothetical protein
MAHCVQYTNCQEQSTYALPTTLQHCTAIFRFPTNHNPHEVLHNKLPRFINTQQMSISDLVLCLNNILSLSIPKWITPYYLPMITKKKHLV